MSLRKIIQSPLLTGKWYRRLGWFLVALASLIVIFKPQNPSFRGDLNLQSTGLETYPQRLLISAIDLDLPVFKVRLKDGQWPVSENGVSYLIDSGSLGQAGKAIFYGHNRTQLLGSLKLVREKDLIEIKDAEGVVWPYEVMQILTVSPQEIEVLKATEEPTLVVYTCAGFLDRQRLVVLAKLKKV